MERLTLKCSLICSRETCVPVSIIKAREVDSSVEKLGAVKAWEPRVLYVVRKVLLVTLFFWSKNPPADGLEAGAAK